VSNDIVLERSRSFARLLNDAEGSSRPLATEEPIFLAFKVVIVDKECFESMPAVSLAEARSNKAAALPGHAR
jgi:hypothetical protein